MTNEEKLEKTRNDLVGKKFKTNQGCELEVIEYISHKNITIKFSNGHIETGIQHSAIKNGNVKNRMFPSVCGIGYEGIGKYSSKTHSLIYDRWGSMLERCYDEKDLKRRPTYRSVEVCEKWANFQIFGEWFDENYIEGFVLDKDILSKNNKIYSPDKCCFVPQEINSLFTKNEARRGEYPIGIGKRCQKYKVRCRVNGESLYLGSYDTIEEAFQVYKTYKEAEIKRVADKWRGQITEQVYRALINYQVKITD